MFGFEFSLKTLAINVCMILKRITSLLKFM